jgi:hypothetical protein
MSKLSSHLRTHAYRIAGGGPGDPNYDPETLDLEISAANKIEELEGRIEELRSTVREFWNKAAAALVREGILE